MKRLKTIAAAVLSAVALAGTLGLATACSSPSTDTAAPAT